MPKRTYTTDTTSEADLYKIADMVSLSGLTIKYQLTPGELEWLKFIKGRYCIYDYIIKRLDGDIITIDDTISAWLDKDNAYCGKATCLSDESTLQKIFWFCYSETPQPDRAFLGRLSTLCNEHVNEKLPAARELISTVIQDLLSPYIEAQKKADMFFIEPATVRQLFVFEQDYVWHIDICYGYQMCKCSDFTYEQSFDSSELTPEFLKTLEEEFNQAIGATPESVFINNYLHQQQQDYETFTQLKNKYGWGQ